MKTQIKSRERVKDLAEVYTAEREVKAMCDLIPSDVWQRLDATFLEPACGDGNFLEEILGRKLALIPKPTPKRYRQEKIEFMILIAVSSIYGIDIDLQNVLEARERVVQYVHRFYDQHLPGKRPSKRFRNLLNKIVDCNIQQADTLNPLGLVITEWKQAEEGVFVQQFHSFETMLTPLFADLPARKGKTFRLY